MEGPDGRSSPSGSGFGATVDAVLGKSTANPQDRDFSTEQRVHAIEIVLN